MSHSNPLSVEPKVYASRSRGPLGSSLHLKLFANRYHRSSLFVNRYGHPVPSLLLSSSKSSFLPKKDNKVAFFSFSPRRRHYRHDHHGGHDPI